MKVIDSARDLGSESEIEAQSVYVPENDIDPVKGLPLLLFKWSFQSSCWAL